MHFFDLFDFGPVLAYRDMVAITIRGKEVRCFTLESDGWIQSGISFLGRDTNEFTFAEVKEIANKMLEIMSM